VKTPPIRIANQRFLARGSFSSRSVLTQYQTLSEPKTLYKKTVHTYELRGCGDLFIWFGGPPTIVSRAPSSAVPSLSLPLACYWLLQRSTCFIFFSVLCGPFQFFCTVFLCTYCLCVGVPPSHSRIFSHREIFVGKKPSQLPILIRVLFVLTA
jgi:hypothetical protein